MTTSSFRILTILLAILVALMLVAALLIVVDPAEAKGPKPPHDNGKPDKVVIVHNSDHNPHQIRVSCKAKGHIKHGEMSGCGSDEQPVPEVHVTYDPKDWPHTHDPGGIMNIPDDAEGGGASPKRCLVE